MSKELTLEELAATSKPRQHNLKKNSEDPRYGAVAMRPQDVEAALIKSGKIKPKEEDPVVEAPLVENAFSSMYDRLERSKDFIENEMMPVVRKNAEEMALEREMNDIGIADDREEDDSNDNIPENNNIATFDEDDDIDALLDADEDSADTTFQVPEEEDDIEKVYRFDNRVGIHTVSSVDAIPSIGSVNTIPTIGSVNTIPTVLTILSFC